MLLLGCGDQDPRTTMATAEWIGIGTSQGPGRICQSLRQTETGREELRTRLSAEHAELSAADIEWVIDDLENRCETIGFGDTGRPE